jgi:hypothetical protein
LPRWNAKEIKSKVFFKEGMGHANVILHQALRIKMPVHIINLSNDWIDVNLLYERGLPTDTTVKVGIKNGPLPEIAPTVRVQNEFIDSGASFAIQPANGMASVSKRTRLHRNRVQVVLHNQRSGQTVKLDHGTGWIQIMPSQGTAQAIWTKSFVFFPWSKAIAWREGT